MNRPGFDGGSDDTEGSLSWDSRKYSLELGERATRTGVGRAGGSGAGQGRHPSDRQGAGNPSRGSEHLGAPGLGPNQGTRPGTTADQAQRIKEPALGVRELRRANAIPKSASACLSRRSVSARPADLPVHRLPQEGGARGLADLQGAHWRRSQDRPELLTHARRSRPPSARSLRDETLKTEISKVHKNQLLGAGGPQDARDAGPTRDRRASRCRSRGPVHRRTPHGRWACAESDAKSPRTTRSAPREQCPADLVKRHFSAFRPNELWVADIPPQAGGAPSYVRTFSGWGYVAFVTDVYSRRIVGWQTTCRPVCTDLALDALKMAIWQRKHTGADLSGLVHHLRPWGAVPSHPLQGSPGRLRGSRLGGFPGRLLSASLWLRHSTRCTRPS